MRILQVTPGYYPEIGGVERHIQALAERLAARGHEVTVATMQPRDRGLPDEVHGGVSIRRFAGVGLGDAYRVPPSLFAFLRSGGNPWDIVHVHNYHAALIPAVAAAVRGPFVVTTHLNDRPHSAFAARLHRVYAPVGKWAVRRAEAVICVTEAERGRVVSRLGVRPDRTVVIPNGVSEALVAKGASGQERDPHLLLSVGRLQPYKRVEDAISILAALGNDYRLVVVGDGPHRAALEEQAAALHVADRVQFVGKAGDDEVLDWYGRAGVLLSLSEAEAFGMTVLEGVAAGCYVVCSDIPAFRDLASQFQQRVAVVPRGDVAQGAEAVRAAAQQAPQGPADVSAFTWEAVADRLLEVYRRVTGAVRTQHSADGQRFVPEN